MEFIKYLKENSIRSLIILKKAVNAEIDGYIENIELITDEKTKIEKIKEIHCKSIFNEEFNLELKKVDAIYINEPNIIMLRKSETSFATNLITKLVAKLHPEKVSL